MCRRRLQHDILPRLHVVERAVIIVARSTDSVSIALLGGEAIGAGQVAAKGFSVPIALIKWKTVNVVTRFYALIVSKHTIESSIRNLDQPGQVTKRRFPPLPRLLVRWEQAYG